MFCHYNYTVVATDTQGLYDMMWVMLTLFHTNLAYIYRRTGGAILTELQYLKVLNYV